METTRKQALEIVDIIKWINPYEVFECDKESYVKSLMEFDLIDNIKELNNYINEGYEDINQDSKLKIKYSNFIKSVIKDLQQQRIDLLTKNNFIRNSEVTNQEKIILTTIEEVIKNGIYT